MSDINGSNNILDLHKQAIKRFLDIRLNNVTYSRCISTIWQK